MNSCCASSKFVNIAAAGCVDSGSGVNWRGCLPMARVGIVGNGTDKFTEKGKHEALIVIRMLLLQADVLVSGHSPMGGIDIWAEEEADHLEIPTDLKIPDVHQWDPPGEYGYKARNLDIARDSDETHVILADVYPEEYAGRRFAVCYHHRNGEGLPDVTPENHVKSGGCWTGKHADHAVWHIVNNY